MQHIRLASLLVAVVVASSGCAAGGLAAVGPVLTALQVVGDRSVDRTLGADMHTSLALADEALARMGLPVQRATAEGDERVLRSSSNGLDVTITLTPATERLTRISVRVEAGRLTADKQTSEEIQNQIARALAERVAAATRPASTNAESIAALEAQVRILRIELERQRDAAPAAKPAPDVKPPFSVDSSAVVTVPSTYGFSTPFSAAPAAMTAVPASRPLTGSVQAPTPPVPDLLPTGLQAAGTLTAVPALGSRDQ